MTTEIRVPTLGESVSEATIGRWFKKQGEAVKAALAGVPGVASVETDEAPEETRARVQCLQGSDPREEIFRLAVAKGWTLRELSRAALSLEDVFVRLTRHDEAAPPPEPAEAAAETAGEPS